MIWVLRHTDSDLQYLQNCVGNSIQLVVAPFLELCLEDKKQGDGSATRVDSKLIGGTNG